MARCYSDAVTKSQTLPHLWLISDARNDAVLEQALRRLPRGSGLVFRHYHLGTAERQARFAALKRIAQPRGILIALADRPALARRWGADGVYGAPRRIAKAYGLVRVATVHSFRELGAAHRAGADLVMLSPVHPTRSHPGGDVLGPTRARLLARRSAVPVVMLGGMTARRARLLAPHGWAAIDGLSGRSCRTERGDTHRGTVRRLTAPAREA